MFKLGNVRLMAAAIAALGLHALFFQFWPHQSHLQLQANEGSSLQVELVKQVAKTDPAAPKATLHPPGKDAATHVLPKQNWETDVAAVAKLEELPQSSEDPPIREDRILSDESAKVAYAAAPESAPAAGAMPADVEQMILTHISYPRQARRRGWQGKATFHLDVREQRLAKLDIFLSSGHILLDRAAMRGIRAVNQLPLANGLYRLPVEFRLQ